MAAIDSRAIVNCSLGPLISGGVNDSYVQNAGLIFTKGQLLIKGAIVPPIGTTVTIGVQGKDKFETLKRNLVVLSSFADPFAETTEVSVGCTLSYKDGVSPAPGVDGNSSYVTPRMFECRNGLSKSAYVPPIHAQDVLELCAEALGMSVSGTQLENPYVMDRLDLSAGYVSVMADLLLSESKLGFCDEFGDLQIVDLNTYQGSAVVPITEDMLISVSGINSGEIAPGVVVVPYISKKLKSYDPDKDKWDEVEIIENVVTQVIDYEGGSVVASHTPLVFSRTEYGPAIKLTDQCKLKDGGFGDLSDKPIFRLNTRTTTLGIASPGYASALLSGGAEAQLDREGILRTEETTTYDEQDRPSQIVTKTFEPEFVYGARLSLPWVFEGPAGLDVVDLSDGDVLVSVVYQEFEYVGNNKPPSGGLIDQSVPDPVVFERRIQRTYTADGMTQGGSQGSAEATTQEAFQNALQVNDHIDNSKFLSLTDVTITTQRRYSPQGEGRPGESDRATMSGTVDGGGRTTKYAEIGYIGPNSDRVVQYRPPLMPESYFTSSGKARKFDTKSVAVNFGRAQHKFAVGNRAGINMQCIFEKFNVLPMSRINVTARGFVGTYMANGTAFTFDSDGAISSTDALFIGGSGYTGIPSEIPPGPPLPSPGPGPAPEPEPIPIPIADAPWYPLPPDYPIDQLPPASDGQIIPPFYEKVNVDAGVALGVSATSNKYLTLESETIALGIAIGVDGTNGSIKKNAFVGIAIGVETISESGVLQTVEEGIAVGVDVISLLVGSRTAEVGIAIGVNLGPIATPPALLLTFDSDFTDTSPNNWPSSNQPTGLDEYYYPSVIPADALAPRFGSGSLYRPNYDGCRVFDFAASPQSFGMTWTLEFWIYLFPDSFPYGGVNNVIFSTVGASAQSYYFSLKTQDGNEMPWLAFNECMSNGWLYYPAVEGPTNGRLPAETWTHCAFVAETVDTGGGGTSNALRIYQNGLRVATGQIIRESPAPVDKVAIGGILDPSDQEVGITGANTDWLIDELRIVVGKAVYTGNSFTPPSGAF